MRVPLIHLLGLLLLVACDGETRPSQLPAAAWLDNPRGWVDRTHVFDGADDWDAGTHAHTAVVSAGRLMIADDAPQTYPVRGSWTSATIETDLPFTELLPSWNLAVSQESGAALFVRARDAGDGVWSPWLYLGSWGRTTDAGKDTTAFDRGRVAIDVLELDRPADAFALRVDLQRFGFATTDRPTAGRVTAVVSGRVDDETERARLDPPRARASGWARDLPVPFIPQRDGPEPMWSDICSPTCMAMVLAFRGVERPLTEHIAGVYDPEHELFGNWGRAIAWAGANGLEAELTRVRAWAQLERYIAAGQPVVASIRFGSGEFPSNVMDSTDGHLIVIRGLTDAGDAIVNDASDAERGNGVVYHKDELARAWFGAGGVAYIVRGEAVSSP